VGNFLANEEIIFLRRNLLQENTYMKGQNKVHMHTISDIPLGNKLSISQNRAPKTE
jgi:hypothetical protein